MEQLYCVKKRKKTANAEPSSFTTTKNGRLMFWCTCAECGIKKTRFIKANGVKGGKKGVIYSIWWSVQLRISLSNTVSQKVKESGGDDEVLRIGCVTE